MDGRWRGKEVSCLFSARNKTVGMLLFFAGLANFKALLERWVFSGPKFFLARSQYRYIGIRKLSTLRDALRGRLAQLHQNRFTSEVKKIGFHLTTSSFLFKLIKQLHAIVSRFV